MYKNTSYGLGLVGIKLLSIKRLDRMYADFWDNFCFVKDMRQIVNTGQKMKFSIKDFLISCGFGHIY